MLSADELDAVERASVDPVWWTETVLGFRPWRKQREILESIRDHRITAVRSCHAIGKSTVAAAAVLWFLANHPRAIVITTASSHRQVSGILWRELRTLYKNARFPLGGSLPPSATMLKMADDWWAWGFTAREYDATQFQGFHAPYVFVVVDEAAGVVPTVYEGLDSAIASGHARMLMIGNPTDDSGPFGAAFKRAGVQKFIVSAFDTPNFSKFGVALEDVRRGDGLDSGPWFEKVTGALPFPQLVSPLWVREKWLEWGEEDPRWQARVMAQFPKDADRALIPSPWIDEAVERWRSIEEGQTWPRRSRLGVDVARLGDDSTERVDFRPGAGVRTIRTAPKQDTMATVATLEGDLVELRSQGVAVDEVRIDADGLGAGVFDRLRQIHGDLAVEVRGGIRADDGDRYVNRRSEMFWQLRLALDPNGDEPIALPPDPALHRQLVAMRWDLNSRGLIAVEPKDDLKVRLGHSPDKADAVAYANARFSDRGIPAVDTDALRTGNPWRDG